MPYKTHIIDFRLWHEESNPFKITARTKKWLRKHPCERVWSPNWSSYWKRCDWFIAAADDCVVCLSASRHTRSLLAILSYLPFFCYWNFFWAVAYGFWESSEQTYNSLGTDKIGLQTGILHSDGEWAKGQSKLEIPRGQRCKLLMVFLWLNDLKFEIKRIRNNAHPKILRIHFSIRTTDSMGTGFVEMKKVEE